MGRGVKRSPIKPRSKKRIAEDRLRAKVKAARFAAFPVCEVPWCIHESQDIHEPLTSARGGSITDPNNVRAVCGALVSEWSGVHDDWHHATDSEQQGVSGV